VNKPQYPDPSLIASIQHEAEKLGYLVAQVEEMFENHAKYDRHQVTVNHALRAGEITKKWLAGEMTDEEMAVASAVLSQTTSDAYDVIKANYQHNINRLNQMVQDGVTNGKGQQDELNATLDRILREE